MQKTSVEQEQMDELKIEKEIGKEEWKENQNHEEAKAKY